MLKNSRLSWINESEAVEQGQPLTEKAGEPEGIWNSPAPSTQDPAPSLFLGEFR